MFKKVSAANTYFLANSSHFFMFIGRMYSLWRTVRELYPIVLRVWQTVADEIYPPILLHSSRVKLGALTVGFFAIWSRSQRLSVSVNFFGCPYCGIDTMRSSFLKHFMMSCTVLGGIYTRSDMSWTLKPILLCTITF